ncbi:hypothetical protein L1887_50269 [Cichorium endivia]|nr:hypothetical protein L1887_50269 [Cichorium endivia]
MFAHLEVALGLWIEEVAHLFVVDFDVADFDGDAEVLVGLGLVANVVKEARAGERDEALCLCISDHGVRLAGAGLAVGKNAGVESVEGMFEELDADVLEEGVLLCVLVVGAVEGEGHGLLLGGFGILSAVALGGRLENELVAVLEFDEVGSATIPLSRVHGSTSDDDLDVAGVRHGALLGRMVGGSGSSSGSSE